MNLTRKSLSTCQYRFVSRGVNTLKSMLMHPKDKVSNDQKKDLVYHWECKADGCNLSYIGETSRALGERVKEHSKSTTSAILKHCKDLHHPLPSISDFNIIDKDPSQITREAKEAIHIRRLDPSLNRNIGKMSIPHCFDHLLGAKPKHPRVGALVTPQSVDEIVPPSQIPGLNLTQFNNIGSFRPNMWLNTYLDLPLGPAGLETCSIDHQLSCHIKSIQAKLFSTWHELSNVIPSSPQECDKHIHTCWSLIATALHTIWHWSKVTEPPEKVWRLLSQLKLFDPKQVSSSSPYIYHPLLVFSSSLLMKTSCLRLKLVELNFFASFIADDQS